MDRNKEVDDACVNLEFPRSQSLSRQEKVKEFWKYLDSQKDLKPYQCPELSEENKSCKAQSSQSPSSSSSSSGNSKMNKKPVNKKSVSKANSKKVSGRKSTVGKEFDMNDLMPKLPSVDTCKLEKQMRETIKFADSVEPSHEDLFAEIDEYEKRLKKLKSENGNCDDDESSSSSDEEAVLNTESK